MARRYSRRLASEIAPDTDLIITAHSHARIGKDALAATKLGGIGDTPFYDPTAFAEVTEARFGTSGFNALRGPGIVNWDFGLFREFKVSERIRIQFRMESFNFTNTPHFDIPDNCVCDGGDFMKITSVTNLAREGIDERQFRFGLRIGF